MAKPITAKQVRGVWSATPTPFTETMRIDKVAVRRLVEHHVRLGIKGLFLCGTCGEGPWMTHDQRRQLIETVYRCNKGRMLLAAQVTDNSSARILDNMKMVKQAGADIAVIAPPHFLIHATPRTVTELYRDAIRKSPLPVGVYDRGRQPGVFVPDGVLKELYAEKNVIMVKDSSADPRRMRIALAARAARRSLFLLNGDEFNTVPYLKAGYDGLLLGGGIFNGGLAELIMKAVQRGDPAGAQKLQDRMTGLMNDIFGGEDRRCWLTGQKELLVQMGIFRTNRSYLKFPLTAACRKAITKAVEREKAILFPG